ncbi:MAG: nicotinate-nucleotide--dimethylbenzimidazole phosphoribosyltransferase [Oscillospiraceae bacterium]|jgi:nicotinate-nucleotide--dimethylbenzimidazole phosphoribosyltransferase|nr:nicotinate-nucleotide--dimethylbenzimidazole phosphoribosyltransferase [Oscillospiraceae bacterium]
MDFTAINNSIPAPDAAAAKLCRAKWDAVAKPLGSLGLLEDAVAQIAALRGDPDVRLRRRAALVLCADNGIVAEGVTQTDASVTMAVARNLTKKQTSVCIMARAANCEVFPVDMGMLTEPDFDGMLSYRLGGGTANFTRGAAMTRETAERGVAYGIELAGDMRSRGFDILATGEMGIGNTTTSSAVCSVLLDVPPETVTGRGSGLSDEGLARKIAAVKRGIATNRPNLGDTVGALAAVGGFDLAGMAGIFIGGARCGVPVLVDGFISAVAALIAVRLCPRARSAVMASHVSAEPAGSLVLDALGLKPLITAGMRLGEGTGAVAALPLLDLALAVYCGGSSFEDIGVEAYTPI